MGRLLAADVLLASLEREHEPAAPVGVLRLAGDPARHPAMCSSVAQKNPNDGPPKSSRLPSGWPSPTAMSTPHSPGGRRTPSVIASTATTSSAPRSFAAAPSASTSSTAPRKFGFWRNTRGGLGVDRRRQRVGVGQAVVAGPTSTTSAPNPRA